MYVVIQSKSKAVFRLNKELMKGSIDILLLSQLSSHDQYGYEIVQTLKLQSGNTYHMSEGTLYPALQRLERKGLVSSYWGQSDKGARRKYYKITDNGLVQLDQQLNEWKKVNALIQICTGGAG
jgi:PadR family transcriptional regulator, regulatory protein PadR